MKKERKKKISKAINEAIKIFWIFVIGSVFGFFAEIAYGIVYTRTVVFRQGLVYGPFIQVYGMGAVAYYLLIRKIQDHKKGNTGISMLFFTRNSIWNNIMGL